MIRTEFSFWKTFLLFSEIKLLKYRYLYFKSGNFCFICRKNSDKKVMRIEIFYVNLHCNLGNPKTIL